MMTYTKYVYILIHKSENEVTTMLEAINAYMYAMYGVGNTSIK